MNTSDKSFPFVVGVLASATGFVAGLWIAHDQPADATPLELTMSPPVALTSTTPELQNSVPPVTPAQPGSVARIAVGQQTSEAAGGQYFSPLLLAYFEREYGKAWNQVRDLPVSPADMATFSQYLLTIHSIAEGRWAKSLI